jgi:hypothetical protein
MKRTILWTQTTTYASEVQVTIAQVARWAAGSALLRTNSPGQSQCHPSPAQIEKMMAANEQFNAFITAAYCQDLGLLRSVDATVKGTGAPTVRGRPK